MSDKTIESARGYSAEATELLRRYEAITFESAHCGVFDLIPRAPCQVLDIGAGAGRDAAWFARRGDRVTAIEPTLKMREGAMALHTEPNISWLDDHLPELSSVGAAQFDIVWMSAVWMHFDQTERAAAMPRVAGLVRGGGALMISLRHGPIPEGRRMFDVGAEETAALARASGLNCLRTVERQSTYAPGVRWSRLWFQRDGAE